MKYNNVYTLFGADSKVGVTMIATSIAETLSSSAKVLVVNANKRLGTDYMISERKGSLDEILNKASSNILEYQDLEKIMISSNKYDVIPGVNELENCRYFQPEHIESIIECVYDRYDLVLIDAGSDIEFSGLAVGALKCTDNTVLVSTQQEKTWNEIENLSSVFKRADISFRYLLVNKMQPKNSGVREPKVIKDLAESEEIMGEVSNSPYSWQAEADHKTLIGFDSNFKKDINGVCAFIASSHNLNFFENENKRTFALFGKK